MAQANSEKPKVADDTHKKGNPTAYSSNKTRSGDRGK